MNLFEQSATTLSKLLEEKKISAVELCHETFQRIKATDHKVQAFLALNEENSMEVAKKVDEKIAQNEQLLPLEGIPISIKDNIAIKNMKLTCGSKMLENFVSPYDATVVTKLKANNALLVGKVNLDEFAMGSSCENSYFQCTKNPYDLSRVPGGSSGGSAAAVASGQTPLSLGSDTGGSVRQPASFCGVLGLKPTYGSVSRYGLVAFASSLDQVGTFARTTEDLATLHQVIAGKDPLDATSVATQLEKLLSVDVDGFTIGLPKEYFGEGIHGETKNAVMNVVKMLEKNGAKLKEISLPTSTNALAVYYTLASAEASSNLGRFDGVKYGFRGEGCENIRDLFVTSRSQGFGDEVQRRILLGTYILSAGQYDIYYEKSKQVQRQMLQEFMDNFQECDLIITPTVPNTAFQLGEKSKNPLEMYASDICTVTMNITGLPAVSVPCGMDGNGLPIGLQIVGPRFSEQQILSYANYMENLLGGWNQIATV